MSDPDIARRCRVRRGTFRVSADVAVLLFLNNARSYEACLRRSGVPFVLTLYPGGGFLLDDPATVEDLRRIAGLSGFAGLIVTQPATRDFVQRLELCDSNRVHYIFGVPCPGRSQRAPWTKWPHDKGEIDVAFAAHKYSQGGRDKGYDVFVAAARELSRTGRPFRFHVMGGFRPTDVELGAAEPRFRFHGALPVHELQSAFAGMDFIVSPNRAGVLGSGAFDGFPSGTVADAVFAGAVAVMTDPLDQNEGRFTAEEVAIVEASAYAVADAVLRMIEDPDALDVMRSRGARKFEATYGDEVQLAPRTLLLRDLISV